MSSHVASPSTTPNTEGTVHTNGSSRVESPDRSVLLRRLLQAYWLRPENAFWMTLRSHVLWQCPMTHPSIDLCCGDGVFSFLHMGGEFDPTFDVFQSVGDLDRVRHDHVDMFDHAERSDVPTVHSSPTDTIDVGTDMKQALLSKAEGLGFYAKLVQHDNNDALPFDDGAFQTVYCNAAYWVANIDGFLNEMRRITAAGGRIILHVKLDSMRRYTLESYRTVLGDRFCDLIDRGRAATWPTLADRTTWEGRFESAGLSILEATPFITKTHAHIWDIGLRPIAPLLVKMTRALTPDTRADIKREWVDLFHELLTPICDPSFHLMGSLAGQSTGDEPAEIQYTLTV